MKLILCSGVPEIYGGLGVGMGMSAMGICAFYSVKLIWCSGVPEMYGQLGGTSAMGICAFFYM